MPDNLPKLSVVVNPKCSGVILSGRTVKGGRTVLQSDKVGELIACLDQSPNLICRDPRGKEIPREALAKYQAQVSREIREAAEKAAAKQEELESGDNPVVEPPAPAATTTQEPPDTAPPSGESTESEESTEGTLELKDGDSFPSKSAGNAKLVEFAEQYGITEQVLNDEGRDNYTQRYEWVKSLFTNL